MAASGPGARGVTGLGGRTSPIRLKIEPGAPATPALVVAMFLLGAFGLVLAFLGNDLPGAAVPRGAAFDAILGISLLLLALGAFLGVRLARQRPPPAEAEDGDAAAAPDVSRR